MTPDQLFTLLGTDDPCAPMALELYMDFCWLPGILCGY